MIRLGKDEIRFLQDYRQQLADNRVIEVAKAFGDIDRFIIILKQIGMEVPSNISIEGGGVEVNPSESVAGIKLLSIDLPSREYLTGNSALQHYLKNYLGLRGLIWTKDIYQDSNPRYNNQYICVYKISEAVCNGGNYPTERTGTMPIIETNDLPVKAYTFLKIGETKWFVLDDNHIILVDPIKDIKFDENGGLDYEKSTIKTVLESVLKALRKENIEVCKKDD